MQTKVEKPTGKPTETVEPSRVEVRGHEELDKLLELVDVRTDEDAAAFALVDATLTDEIVKILRGHSHEDCFFNIPYFKPSKTGGKKSWPACKLIDGGCSYQQAKTDHIHVVGVGYWGFVTAAQAYGRITVRTLTRPTVIEEGDVLYWATHAMAHDGHNGNEIDRWYLEEALMQTRQGLVDKPHADGIGLSKCIRNVLAFLIPRKLIAVWTEDYLQGRAIMDPQRAIEMGFGRAAKGKAAPPPEPATTPPKQAGGTAHSQTAKNLTAAKLQLATKIDTPVEMLREYLVSIHPRSVQRRLQAVTQGMGDETKAKELAGAISVWADARAQAEVEQPNEPVELFPGEADARADLSAPEAKQNRPPDPEC